MQKQTSKSSKYNIYFPMTCNILTVGHIKCLEILSKKGMVTVGLLDSRALKGYKKEIVKYEDRKYILDTISKSIPNIRIVRQSSLNPLLNLSIGTLSNGNYTHLASGDGFEEQELKALKKLSINRLNIKLPKEKTKKYSSSAILSMV